MSPTTGSAPTAEVIPENTLALPPTPCPGEATTAATTRAPSPTTTPGICPCGITNGISGRLTPYTSSSGRTLSDSNLLPNDVAHPPSHLLEGCPPAPQPSTRRGSRSSTHRPAR